MGFPLCNLHLDGKTDNDACSEVVTHSSQSVVGLVKGFPAAAGGGSVRLPAAADHL